MVDRAVRNRLLRRPDLVQPPVPEPQPLPPTPDLDLLAILKTPLMRRVEREYGLYTEELIGVGGLTEIARELLMDQSGIYKWRKRLGL